MNNELKMLVHEMIGFATQALKRNDEGDDHWKVLLSLLRYRAKDLSRWFEENEGEEE